MKMELLKKILESKDYKEMEVVIREELTKRILAEIEEEDRINWDKIMNGDPETAIKLEGLNYYTDLLPKFKK